MRSKHTLFKAQLTQEAIKIKAISITGENSEGVRYVKSELNFLGLRRLHLWPSAVLRNAVKLLGYKLGQQEAHLPIVLKRRFGMYKRFWDGPFAVGRGKEGDL